VGALNPSGQGAINPGFAGCGDTTGVVNKESDQKNAIPLVKRNRAGLKRGPGVETRRLRWRSVGKHLLGYSHHDLQITLCDCARWSGWPWSCIRVARCLAAADYSTTTAPCVLRWSHGIRERRDLRQEERQSKERRQYVPCELHSSRRLIRRSTRQ
jgi:hypothetical protein